MNIENYYYGCGCKHEANKINSINCNQIIVYLDASDTGYTTYTPSYCEFGDGFGNGFGDGYNFAEKL